MMPCTYLQCLSHGCVCFLLDGKSSKAGNFPRVPLTSHQQPQYRPAGSYPLLLYVISSLFLWSLALFESDTYPSRCVCPSRASPRQATYFFASFIQRYHSISPRLCINFHRNHRYCFQSAVVLEPMFVCPLFFPACPVREVHSRANSPLVSADLESCSNSSRDTAVQAYENLVMEELRFRKWSAVKRTEAES
jgi:hypothetical protein